MFCCRNSMASAPLAPASLSVGRRRRGARRGLGAVSVRSRRGADADLGACFCRAGAAGRPRWADLPRAALCRRRARRRSGCGLTRASRGACAPPRVWLLRGSARQKCVCRRFCDARKRSKMGVRGKFSACGKPYGGPLRHSQGLDKRRETHLAPLPPWAYDARRARFADGHCGAGAILLRRNSTSRSGSSVPRMTVLARQNRLRRLRRILTAPMPQMFSARNTPGRPWTP